MQDVIYKFTWLDIKGEHSTTTVGSSERNDMNAYLIQLESSGLIWNAQSYEEGLDT